MGTIESETAKIKDAQARQIFGAMMEEFYKRWAPDDKYEVSRFAAELHSLIRQVYREAQEPVFKQLEAVIRALPMAPFLGSPKL